MIFGIDFDGTCVHHKFPDMGDDVPFADVVLKAIVKAGHELILFTMRSDNTHLDVSEADFKAHRGDFLTPAIDWFIRKELPLYGIQRNPDQDSWTTSPKAYCNIYIDDSALGCPLIYDTVNPPFVDWLGVKDMLLYRGLIEDPFISDDDNDLPF